MKGKHIADIEHRRCFSCKSYDTFRYKPNSTYRTAQPIWRHLPDDPNPKHWYCYNCYYRLLGQQKEYQKERYSRLRDQILEIRKQQRDENRVNKFSPRSVTS